MKFALALDIFQDMFSCGGPTSEEKHQDMLNLMKSPPMRSVSSFSDHSISSESCSSENSIFSRGGSDELYLAESHEPQELNKALEEMVRNSTQIKSGTRFAQSDDSGIQAGILNILSCGSHDSVMDTVVYEQDQELQQQGSSDSPTTPTTKKTKKDLSSYHYKILLSPDRHRYSFHPHKQHSYSEGAHPELTLRRTQSDTLSQLPEGRDVVPVVTRE